MVGRLALSSNVLLSKDMVSSQWWHPGQKCKCVELPLEASVNHPLDGWGWNDGSFLHLDPTILELSRYLNVHWAKIWLSYHMFLYKNLSVDTLYALHLSIFIMTEILFFPCWIESWDHNPYVKIFSLSACFCSLKTAFFIPLQSFYMIIVEKLKNKGRKKEKAIYQPTGVRDSPPTCVGRVLRKQVMDFPGGPMVKTLGFHCGEHGFSTCLET